MAPMRSAVLLLALLIGATVFGQDNTPASKDFLKIAGDNIEKTHHISLFEACPIADGIAERTVFAEYGAIFVASGGATIPSRCIFADGSAVLTFQNSVRSKTMTVGGSRITLQEAAMNALAEAREEGRKRGLSITPRGGSIAAKRSFADTKRLWDSRFLPALDYWTGKGRISKKEASAAKALSIADQISTVLNWETESIYFAKGFSKSILFSVAAPGASQHISMLALDVQQFSNRKVRDLLAKHGWFQTVRSDFPHFTYLGVTRERLGTLGLKKVLQDGYEFWVPDLSEEVKN